MLLEQIVQRAAELKYANFSGRILILGYGSVGQAIVPLILRHIDVNPELMTILEKDDHHDVFLKRHGKTRVKYLRKEILQSNYESELSKHVSAGDLIVNCSLNIDAISLITWCLQNDVMQIDTSLERWGSEPDETIPNPADRTLFRTHERARQSLRKFQGGSTCVVTHGANPGYVTHLTKRALLHIAKHRKIHVRTPTSRGEWAELMRDLGVKTIHIAERDTQVVNDPKLKDEFVNTWSCEGFWAEGRAPTEMGWGSHEQAEPEGGRTQGTSAFLFQPGVSVLMKSWVPKGGQYNGFCIQHSESITINQYFSTLDGTFRPSVYYVYQPCDTAITSIHEMRGNELDLQKKLRIAKDEIISGIDELGVLLIGDDFAWFHGSELSIDEARKSIKGESATSVQVGSSMLAAIVWMIRNPNNGYTEPEDLPFEFILRIADPYWEPLVSVPSSWTPSQDVNSLFYRKIDETNRCKFENFRVWT